MSVPNQNNANNGRTRNMIAALFNWATCRNQDMTEPIVVAIEAGNPNMVVANDNNAENRIGVNNNADQQVDVGRSVENIELRVLKQQGVIASGVDNMEQEFLPNMETEHSQASGSNDNNDTSELTNDMILRIVEHKLTQIGLL